MSEQYIELKAKDGHAFNAFRVTSEDSAPGLVILQEIFGITEQLKGMARFFAQQGYNAIVPALFDRVERDAVIPYAESERGRGLMLRLKPDEVMQDIQAAVAEVDAGQGVVVIGFCWGGGMAIRAAGSMPLAGAVSYYGTSLDRHTKNRAQCPCLLHFGDSDPLVPHEIRDLVKQRIADARVYAYAAGHAFANEARTNYVADAAALAHQRTLDFLHEIFSGQ